MNVIRGIRLVDAADGLPAGSGATDRELTKPMALLVTHMFNHLTHHRGQVHALLIGFGMKLGVTDLPFNPESYAG